MQPAGQHAAPLERESFGADPARRTESPGLESAEESSDEHTPDDGYESEVDADVDGHSIVGFSISRAQTRLAAPSTPAAEKEAILRLSNGTASVDLYQSLDGTRDINQDPPETVHGSEPSPSSIFGFTPPWRNASKPSNRPRAATGPQELDGAATSRRLLPSFTLPKLTHGSMLPSISYVLNRKRAGSGDGAQSPSRSKLSDSETMVSAAETQALTQSLETVRRRQSMQDLLVSANASASKEGTARPVAQSNLLVKRQQLLRKSTSDGSLNLARAMSRASSLGDDRRWENVHEQVNSRMKALRDSLADSNLRMPRISMLNPIKDSNSADENSLRHRLLNTSPGARPRRDMGMLGGGGLPTDQHRAITSPPAIDDKMSIQHPHFARTLKHLKGDLVILGGYRGSVLRSAEPPHRQCWVPLKVGLNIRKVNLEVGFTDEDEEHSTDRIIPSGMLKHIGPVDISRRLFKRLRASRSAQSGELRVHDYGYDWRLSPDVLSEQLFEFIKALPCNKPGTPEGERGATVIAHSLGGLLVRHAVNRDPSLFSSVVYAGVPQHCVNILGPLRNGDDVFMSSRVLTAQVNFSIRTSFALLPLSGQCFIDRDTKERYDVDFFDPKTWEEHCLSPCIAHSLPPDPAPQPTGMIGTMQKSISSVLPQIARLPKRNSISSSPTPSPRRATTSTDPSGPTIPTSPQLNHNDDPQLSGVDRESAVETATTLPRDVAERYLAATLARTKRFKESLAFQPRHAAAYPPTAVIYGKAIPTVYGARVHGRAGIRRADAYDELAFASGDGVVLARAAQLPDGYHSARGGVVSSDRGHISLLGDLEAVGRCLNAVMLERRRRLALGARGGAERARGEREREAERRDAQRGKEGGLAGEDMAVDGVGKGVGIDSLDGPADAR